MREFVGGGHLGAGLLFVTTEILSFIPLNETSSYHQLKRYDKAIIFHERSLSLANEANYHDGIATAFAGIAEEYVAKTLFKMAQKYFERALVVREDLEDRAGIAQVCRGLEKTMVALHNKDIATIYAKRASAIENEMHAMVSGGIESIAKIKEFLYGCSVAVSHEVPFELRDPLIPRLIRDKEVFTKKIKEIEKEKKKVQKKHDRLEATLKQMKEQKEMAETSEQEYFDSKMVHGATQRFRLSEIRQTLDKEIAAAEKTLAELAKQVRTLDIRKRNNEDDLRGIEDELATETGVLMTKVKGKKRIRSVCMHPMVSSSLVAEDESPRCAGGRKDERTL